MARRPELVFLHGGPGYPDYLAEYFRDAFTPAFGLTFYDQAQGPHIRLKNLIIQLDAIVRGKGENVFLVGHSWGVALAIEYMMAHPKSVRGLAMIAPCVKRSHTREDFLEELQRRGIDRADIESVFFTEAEKPLGRPLLERITPMLDTELLERFNREHLDTLDLSSKIASLEVPVLNAFGSEDVRIPARSVARLIELNPRVTNLEIAGAGHFPFLLEEHRARLVDEVSALVGRARI